MDLASPEAAYRQIAGQIRLLIVEGVLNPGDPLPGVRRLSLDLGVHHNTVAEAYRQLANEGWIDVSHGKTARITDREAPVPAPSDAERFRDRLRHLVAEMRTMGFPAARIHQELQNFTDSIKP